MADPREDSQGAMQATERLAELIRCKRGVLAQLRDFALRQVDLVASGDTASLLKLLAVKQQLIDTLQDLERELAPRYEEDPDQRVWLSQEMRAECARQAAECNDILREIVGLEKSSAETMMARRNEGARELEQVHAAAQIRGAYEAHRRTHA